MAVGSAVVTDQGGVATIVGGGLVVGGNGGALNGPCVLLISSFTGETSVIDIEGQNITELRAPNLVTVSDEAVINFRGHPITRADFPSLESIDSGGYIGITNGPLLGVNFPRLSYIGNGGNLDFHVQPEISALSSISFPSLSRFGPGFPQITLSRYPSLSFIEFPALSVVESISLSALECALTLECVNRLLIQINALRSSTDISIDVSGGTSAAPTGAGLAAAAAMTNDGCSITTN